MGEGGREESMAIGGSLRRRKGAEEEGEEADEWRCEQWEGNNSMQQ